MGDKSVKDRIIENDDIIEEQNELDEKRNKDGRFR